MYLLRCATWKLGSFQSFLFSLSLVHCLVPSRAKTESKDAATCAKQGIAASTSLPQSREETTEIMPLVGPSSLC